MTGDRALRRLIIAAVLIALVVVMVLFDAPSTHRQPVAVPVAGDQAQIGAIALTAPSAETLIRATPRAAPLGAASTTWFCGGGAAGGAANAASTLVLSNRGSGRVTATISSTTTGGNHDVTTVEVPARTSRPVPLGSGTAGTAAAVVESRGGGLVVSQRIGSGDTITTASCATASSESWYFAGGDTQRGSTDHLVLFNPFDDVATADVTFITPDGFRQPQASQGLPVPGRSVVVVDAASVQNRRSNLASAVTTRAGRLVVWRTQSFDGSGPKLPGAFAPKGVSVALGASVPLARFALPTTVTGDGVVPRVLLANFGTVDSTVRLTFEPDDPATNGQPPVMTVKVPSGSVTLLGAAQLRQVPAGVPFSIAGDVTSGGPIVADLWLDGADPAKGHGSGAVTALPVASTSWVVPIGLTGAPLDLLGVAGAGRTTTFRVSVLADGHITRLRLPAGAGRVTSDGRVTLDLASLLGKQRGAAVLVTSHFPVVVSRLQAGVDAGGLVTFAGIPAGPLARPIP